MQIVTVTFRTRLDKCSLNKLFLSIIKQEMRKVLLLTDIKLFNNTIFNTIRVISRTHSLSRFVDSMIFSDKTLEDPNQSFTTFRVSSTYSKFSAIEFSFDLLIFCAPSLLFL